ncbi:MAG TPA: NAD-dependent epimerase/dehydratase family protein, partial [bacterium]|nr:NAD-dependent epimerase/dehydratase family protein [bacterium]
MNVLVTGGAGFIGSHLAEALVAAGHRVRVLDNLSTGSLENLSGVRSALDFREGDVLDPASAAAAVEGVDAVLHQAALPSVPRSFSAPVETTAVNCG